MGVVDEVVVGRSKLIDVATTCDQRVEGAERHGAIDYLFLLYTKAVVVQWLIARLL